MKRELTCANCHKVFGHYHHSYIEIPTDGVIWVCKACEKEVVTIQRVDGVVFVDGKEIKK
jgi:RNase P subunit RPR2